MEEITITREMVEAAEEAVRCRRLLRKTQQQWLAEIPDNDPPHIRSLIASHLRRRASIAADKARMRLHHLCPTPELRMELLDMIEREQAL